MSWTCFKKLCYHSLKMNGGAAIKSVIVSGNLNDNLVYKLCPNTEFSDGAWNVTIKSIGYSCLVPNFKDLCQISCNLVKSQRYKDSYEVESYDQPFNIFLLETKTTSLNLGKSFIKLD